MATTLRDANKDEQYYAAFSTAIYYQELEQIHQDDLLPPPANWKEMQQHP
jgi:hypothetical protein